MKPTVGLIFVAIATTAVHGVKSIGFGLPVVSDPPSIFASFCPKVCPTVMSPVFDENGVQYDNRCKMQAAKCKQKGTTSSKSSEGTAEEESAFGSFCPDACLSVMKPVYDENGVMYANACKMQVAKCKQKKNRASNKDSSSSAKTTKSPAKKCTNTCPDIILPVCGSNGVRYSSPCKLKVAACNHPELNIVESDTACVSYKTLSELKVSKTASFSDI